MYASLFKLKRTTAYDFTGILNLDNILVDCKHLTMELPKPMIHQYQGHTWTYHQQLLSCSDEIKNRQESFAGKNQKQLRYIRFNDIQDYQDGLIQRSALFRQFYRWILYTDRRITFSVKVAWFKRTH